MIQPIADRIRIVPFFFLLALLLGLASMLSTGDNRAAWAVEAVDVSGTVRNGTLGGEVPVGLEVLLHRFGDEGQIDVVATLTQEDGSYTFQAVEAAENSAYAVVTNFQGVPYSAAVPPPVGSESIELVVYETLQSIDIIRLEADIMLIDRGADKSRLSALEAVGIMNDGDHTFVPDLEQPANFNFMRFSLPEGAINLDVGSDLPGGEIINIGTGFALTAPVKPGRHQVTYTYVVPYSGSSTLITRSFPMGVDTFGLLVRADLGSVESTQLVEQQQVDIGGITYASWESEKLAPGQRVSYRISGLPTPSWWGKTKESFADGQALRIGLPETLAAVLIAMLTYALVSHRRRNDASPAAPESSEQGLGHLEGIDDMDEDQMVQMIAHLDDLYEQEWIDEEEYQRSRQIAKDHLLRTVSRGDRSETHPHEGPVHQEPEENLESGRSDNSRR